MKKLLLYGIILKIAKKIKQERTASSIYHLLTGRRSIQTMQDAYIYGMEDYFGICKSLTKQDFQASLRALIQKGHLIEKHDVKQRRILQTTASAEEWLKKHEALLSFHYFKGMLYHEKTDIFYQRLLLIIQTLTNTIRNHFSFIPVVDQSSTEQWVKMFYKKVRGKEQAYLNALEKDLVLMLALFPSEEANIFVDRLTGYKHYGKSTAQLANTYNKDKSEIQLLLVGIIQTVLSRIKNHETEYPALSALIQDEEETIPLLGSTAQTYRLFKQNYSPEEIATIRKLKINTIYDHLAEIALHDPAFPFQQFLPKKVQEEILSAMKQTGSYKLKEIKAASNLEISFFQIRLMLMLHQQLKEEGASDA